MVDRKRIVFLIYGLMGGGAEHSCITTANQLAKRGNDVSIYLLCNDKKTIFEIDPHVKVYGTPPLRFGYVVSSFLIYTQWILQRNVPDVLISYMWAANFFAAWMARIFKIPVILSERSNPEMARPFSLPHTEENAKRLFRYAEKIVVLDDEIGEYMSQNFLIPRKKFVTIFNSRNEVACKDPKPGWLPGRYLLAAGRLCRVKGFDRLIRMFSRIAEQVNDVALVICGEGELKDSLQKQINDLHMQGRILLAGIQKNMPPIYANAEAFLLTSHYEGLPGVILESLIWGKCPAISFDVKYGPSNIITHGKNGLLIPQDDEDAFVNAVVSYLKDPAMRSNFVRNIPETVKKFSPECIMEQWEKVIAEAAEKRG